MPTLLLKPIRKSKLNTGIIEIPNVDHACVIMGDKYPYPLRLKVFKADGKTMLFQTHYKYKWK